MLAVPQAALRIGAYVVVDLDDTVPLIDEKICSDPRYVLVRLRAPFMPKHAGSKQQRRDWPGLRGAFGFFLVHQGPSLPWGRPARAGLGLKGAPLKVDSALNG